MEFTAMIRRHKAGKYTSFYITIPAGIFDEGFVMKVGDIWRFDLKARIFEAK